MCRAEFAASWRHCDGSCAMGRSGVRELAEVVEVVPEIEEASDKTG
jgi:hypothetical protein